MARAGLCPAGVETGEPIAEPHLAGLAEGERGVADLERMAAGGEAHPVVVRQHLPVGAERLDRDRGRIGVRRQMIRVEDDRGEAAIAAHP